MTIRPAIFKVMTFFPLDDSLAAMVRLYFLVSFASYTMSSRTQHNLHQAMEVSLAPIWFDHDSGADCVQCGGRGLEGISTAPTRIRRRVSCRSGSLHGQLQNGARPIRDRAHLFAQRRTRALCRDCGRFSG